MTKRPTFSMCFYCGATGRMTVEHLVPLSKGGLNRGVNLVGACRRCNPLIGNYTRMEEVEGRDPRLRAMLRKKLAEIGRRGLEVDDGFWFRREEERFYERWARLNEGQHLEWPRRDYQANKLNQ